MYYNFNLISDFSLQLNSLVYVSPFVKYLDHNTYRKFESERESRIGKFMLQGSSLKGKSLDTFDTNFIQEIFSFGGGTKI